MSLVFYGPTGHCSLENKMNQKKPFSGGKLIDRMVKRCGFSGVHPRLGEVNLRVHRPKDLSREVTAASPDPRAMLGSNTGAGDQPALFSLVYEAMMNPQLGVTKTVIAMGTVFRLTDGRGERNCYVIAIKPDGNGGRCLSFVRCDDLTMGGRLNFNSVELLTFTPHQLDKHAMAEDFLRNSFDTGVFLSSAMVN